jgi:hypothetical protein
MAMCFGGGILPHLSVSDRKHLTLAVDTVAVEGKRDYVVDESVEDKHSAAAAAAAEGKLAADVVDPAAHIVVVVD